MMFCYRCGSEECLYFVHPADEKSEPLTVCNACLPAVCEEYVVLAVTSYQKGQVSLLVLFDTTDREDTVDALESVMFNQELYDVVCAHDVDVEVGNYFVD